MNVLFKVFSLCFIILLLPETTLAQHEEVEDDLKFVGFNTDKSTTKKMLFNFTFASANSFLVGSDSKQFREDLKRDAALAGLDKYIIGMHPGFTVGFLTYYKFNRKIHLGSGIQYSLVGWKEVASLNFNSSNRYRAVVGNNYHYLQVPIYFRFRPVPKFGIRIGYRPSILVRNWMRIREVYIVNGERETEKQDFSFESFRGFTSKRYNSIIFIGFDVEVIDKILFTFGVSNSLNLMNKRFSNFKLTTVEIGFQYEF